MNTYSDLPSKILALISESLLPLYNVTLPLLWRTFIWDVRAKAENEQTEAWELIVGRKNDDGGVDVKPARGAEYIRFFVDRTNHMFSSDKLLPPFLSQLASHQRGHLKSYIAEFNDTKQWLIKSDDRKVGIHLLPAYEPVGYGKGGGGDQDYITLRHALVWLSPSSLSSAEKQPMKQEQEETNNPSSIGYAFFIIHPSLAQPTHPLPTTIHKYTARHRLPLLPFTIDAILIAPSSNAFSRTDAPRLSHIVFELLVSLDQEPRIENTVWNGFIGQFSTRRVVEEEVCRSYIEFHWQKSEESMIICAEAAAQALNPFRSSKTYNWIELLFSNHSRFPHNNRAIHTILDTLLPHYLCHAARRVCPPKHEMGDIVVQDISRDLLAALKRVINDDDDDVVPDRLQTNGVKTEEGTADDRERVRAKRGRNVVEYFIKRYPNGRGKKDKHTFHDSHDRYRKYYKEFAV